MSRKRFVITGLGVVSPIGIGKDLYWHNVTNGNSGFKPISLFDTSSLAVKTAGEISSFDAASIVGSPFPKDIGRATLLLSAALKLCLDDAGIQITDKNFTTVGLCVGTTFGSIHSTSEFDKESLVEGPRYVNPSVFPNVVGNAPASYTAIKFQIKGFNTTISTGMCSFTDALNYSASYMDLDSCSTILVGAVEDLCIQTFLGLYKLNYLSGLSKKQSPISCPFDKRRDGIIFSEGSTVFALEELNAARKQKRKIYAEVIGFGSCFDPAKRYNYNPKGTGMAQAMQKALNDARLKARHIDCIFANANSTPEADAIETKAIKEVFGSASRRVPVTSIKSSVGETYSASGGMSLAAALAALDKNLIPPTMSYLEKDHCCDLDYVANKPRSKRLARIMINTFSPTGENTVVIVGRPGW